MNILIKKNPSDLNLSDDYQSNMIKILNEEFTESQ